MNKKRYRPGPHRTVWDGIVLVEVAGIEVPDKPLLLFGLIYINLNMPPHVPPIKYDDLVPYIIQIVYVWFLSKLATQKSQFDALVNNSILPPVATSFVVRVLSIPSLIR